MRAKAELRKRLSRERDALRPEDVADRSARIRARVLEAPEVVRASSVFAYVSAGNEPDTRELIRAFLAAGKTVVVPLIVGEGRMEAHRIAGIEDLAPGEFGILAPGKPDRFDGTPDITICPGVAFTERGCRMGRGKAFYDRFLANHPGTFAIGLCYEFQVVDDLPVEATDCPVDAVITESRTLRR